MNHSSQNFKISENDHTHDHKDTQKIEHYKSLTKIPLNDTHVEIILPRQVSEPVKKILSQRTKE